MHWLHRHRLWIIAGICIVVTMLVIALHFLPDIPFFSNVWRGEQNVEDLLRREGRKTATRQDFVFLGIDQESREFQPFDDAQIASSRALQLMAAKPFPWSREVWALLLDRLCGAGARLVMFDVSFSPTNEGDPAFRAALDRYRDKVVIGANFDFSNVGEHGGIAKNVPPNASLIPEPQMQDDRVGYIVFFPDWLDQKIRSIHYTVTDMQLARQNPLPGEIPHEALSARALEKLGHGADVPRDLKPRIFRFSALDAYQPRPLWEVFDDKIWHANYKDGAFFKDKVIIVGSSAQIVHDAFDTPLGPETPGPALHLHALAAGLDHEFLYDVPINYDFLTISIAGILSWMLLALIRRPLVCLLALGGVTVLYLGLVRILYDQSGILLMVVPTLAAFLVSGLVGLGFEYTLEILERRRTRRTLERYVSKNLVQEILDNPDSYYHSLLGVRVPATMLFSDLVGFTTLSEKADPEELVRQLNEYLTQMTAVVFRNGGTLDKFIGDAIMAVWGNVRSFGQTEDAKRAVRTAIGMRRELQKLNEGWLAEGRLPLGMGVGINHGEVIVGNIGSHERMDPTVIGDAVNLASRLEGLTRIYGVDVLLGATAAELVRDEFHLRSVARAQVKGKSEPVDIFTPVGARNDAVDLELIKWLESYEDGILKFRSRDFTQAKILFSRFLEFYPEDFLAKMYLERALEYEQQAPDEAWNAVEVFKKK
jgi:adenylate cyclase